MFLPPQHSAELLAVRGVTEEYTRELRTLYEDLVSLREEQTGTENGRHLDHPALLREIRKEIDKLKEQVTTSAVFNPLPISCNAYNRIMSLVLSDSSHKNWYVY